ncbi:serine hydrolase [Lentilactobacillus hilgardii]|uniref:serine hydrolase n=1 Tax=Lentilactobacillus hilgardii TaxID=1588 RepID=UPI003FA5ABA5
MKASDKQRMILHGLMIFILIFSISMQHKISSSSFWKRIVVTKNIPPKLTTHMVTQKQNSIQNRLSHYIKQQTKGGTTSIAFYNLSPIRGSHAAKSKYSPIYSSGSLAVQSRGNSPMIAASTYKLFISAYLFNQNKDNNFDWNNTNLDGFNRMIVYSENDFADNELMNFGMPSVNAFINDNHWYAPVFTTNKDATTTAHSLLNLLYKLKAHKKPFTNLTERKMLLTRMKKQVYRTGIPTGASEADKGSVTEDKVGFLGSVNNDAGIVTLPSGQRYILVIMTNASNQSGFSGFPRIAKITRKMQSIAYSSVH